MTALPTKPKTREEEEACAQSMISRGGYKRGGRLAQEDDAAQDRRMVKSAVGEPKTKLKLKRGGEVHGEKPVERMDKRSRGGAMPEKAHGKGGKKPPVEVNIISPAASDGEKKQAAAAGMQAGAQIGAKQAMAAGAGGGPPKPPMGAGAPPRPMPPPPGAGAGGPPPGAMPPEQGPMKRGGRAERKRGGEC